MDRLSIELEPGTDPVFLRIARAVARDVARGRLRPGDPLPGSRTLAETLGVHRNTVLAAFRELEAEGWIETLPAKATRVRAELPDRTPARRTKPAQRDPDRIGFALTRPAPEIAPSNLPPGAIALFGGLPDLRRVPAALIARAYRRAATAKGGSTFGYGDPRGEPELRAALAGILSRARGLAIDKDDIIVTRGSQMALHLAARALFAPGDVVLVEELGYRPAWEALRAAGAILVPVRVDRGGIDVAAARAACEAQRVRAIYVTPHHQYPTTVLLSSARRLELLALAHEHQIALLEDDYDHEFHYDGRPVLPLASADVHGSVVYFGTLSKILAPALRTGFMVAPRPLLSRAAAHRAIVDRQGDRVLERALAEFIEDGELVRHARRMRRLYETRRKALATALEAHLSKTLTFTLPKGGMALWARVQGVDIEAWAEACEARGVVFQTAKRFTFDGRKRQFVRLGFAGEAEPRLERAARKMAEAAASLRAQ